MTTIVTVEVHCDDSTTLVRVDMYGDSDIFTAPEHIYLKDGEKKEFHVYGDRIIAVSEIPMQVKEGDEEEDKQ